MSTRRYDEILDESLRMLQAGASIDDCVSPYPEHADELRAQLQTAQTVLAARVPMQPDASAQAQGRARLLVAVAEQRQFGEAEPTLGLVAPLRALLGGARSRLVLLPQALPAVLAMLVLGGAAWGVAAATGNPNPGNWFAGSSSREERIALRGAIVAIDASSLTLATPSGEVPVVLTPQTKFEDENRTPLTVADFAPGDLVKVSAFRDEAGALIAREVEREDERDGQDDGNPEDDDATDDHSGPGGPNSGPGSGEDDDQQVDEDNSGPGNAEDGEGTTDDDDNSGPGSEDDEGQPAPQPTADADDDEPEDDGDHSGPGGGGDGDDNEEEAEEHD